MTLAAPERDFDGRVWRPGEPGYERGRLPASLNRETESRPQLVLAPASTTGVAQAVRFATAAGLSPSVRSGGHDALGASVRGDVVIDLSALDHVRVERAGRRAVVGAGVRSCMLLERLATSGLRPVLGCDPDVGVAGLVLGGGLGWLLGSHGAACDQLLAATLVTAAGDVRHVSSGSDPELLWALRGGGANFGVVSELELALHEDAPVLGGTVLWRGQLRGHLERYLELMADAPDALSVELSVVTGADPLVALSLCWSGGLAAGRVAVEPWLVAAGTVADNLDVVGLGDVAGRPLAGGPARRGRGPRACWRGLSMLQPTPDALAAIAGCCAGAPQGSTVGLGHYLHGEACREERAATSALPRRRGSFCTFVRADWDASEQDEAMITWVQSCAATLAAHALPGTYPNYLSSEEEPAVRASYGRHYGRLAALKARLDPANVFCHNRNVRPAGAC